MSFINNEELKKITNGSSINMQTIDFKICNKIKSNII